MLMRKLVYVVLLIILGGCISPSPSLEDIHQRVAKQVEVLIDSGYLLTTYIEIDEVFSTDSIHFIISVNQILLVLMVLSYLPE